MGIDRIGKSGPPPAPDAGGAGAARPTEASRPFEVSAPKPEAARAEAPSALAPTPLEQLRAGRIDVNGYVDCKVEEATVHLRGLGAKELSALKEILRAQIVSDPALADLVTQAAGAPPREE